MSRRLYRQMAQARASLNDMKRGRPVLSAEQLATIEHEQAASEAELDAVLARQRARTAELLRKVEHPVVVLTGKPFRVSRLFRCEAKLQYEHIGEALTIEVATEIMKREQWRAQVFDCLGMVRADNWHGMERR